MFNYDTLVVGAGHAGTEAALACARLGLKTAIFTINLDNIGVLSCNPSIGGPAKGHLVKEIDALGGEMGKNSDKSFLQIRTLNTRKGPAVQATRAQADKLKYNIEMKKTIEEQKNLDAIQAMITEVIVENGKTVGVKSKAGVTYSGKSVIIATGTFMNGLIHIGDKKYKGGRMGELSSDDLPNSLTKIGLKLQRFKTGTPPRLDGKSIDYTKVEPQYGDTEKILKFSKDTDDLYLKDKKQLPCHLAFTNKDVHNVVLENLDRAPLFNGSINGTGPRYCPSIEDKIVRYKEKDRHQVFLEPEGYDTYEIYANGLPTSLPTDIQESIIQGISGLEKAKIMRYGYAIEYDYILPEELKLTLETKKIENLFLAGQINGTSGYEEAASQGLLAGINAAQKLKDREPIILDRADSYIGTLIDDLVTKGTNEPYRMFTARSEYRLLLREDNADIRLSRIGYEVGLLSKKRYDMVNRKIEDVAQIKEMLRNYSVGIKNEKVNKILDDYKEPKLKSGTNLLELLKRPKVTYEDIKKIAPELENYDSDTEYQVEVQVKYEGYIKKQERMIKKHKELENKKLPLKFDYYSIQGLTKEAQDKLSKIMPENIGQASRISGVSPADISILLINMKSGALR